MHDATLPWRRAAARARRCGPCGRRVSVFPVRIWLRLSMALSGAALVLFGAVGVWQLRAEESELRRAVEHDLSLLGRSLAVSFENALRDRQEEDVEETLRGLESLDPEVDVFVYDAAGALLAASRGAIERTRWLAARPTEPEMRFVPGAGAERAELLLPLRITREERAATLVIARPLDEMRDDLHATRIRVGFSVAAFVLLVGVLTAFLARLWVAGPLDAMVRQMRRVRGGDLGLGVLPVRSDEVGTTLGEFEALVAELRRARARIEAEEEARRRVEAQLREVDKLRVVGTLAAGLAHEIGSPLQVLEGRLASLASRADDPDEVRRVARILLEQAQRITRIVTRLLGLARRPAGPAGRVDARAAVRTVVELLESECRRRGVQLTLEAATDSPVIIARADEVQQLSLNLIKNAIEACERGGRVTVRLRKDVLQDPIAGALHALRLEVEDSGGGMDPETAAQAFEPFFTTRADEGGTGLGLAVCKGIVDDLGGRIELRSEPGRGTTVTVRLSSSEPEGAR